MLSWFNFKLLPVAIVFWRYLRQVIPTPFTDDPEVHAICGMSSGGICAFTAAWQRPDQFRKVLSHIGRLTNIRGGDAYPGLIRKGEKKPLRVFLKDGSNDLDNAHGNWPLGNKEMFAALKFRDYDVKFDFGEGSHNGNHGGRSCPIRFAGCGAITNEVCRARRFSLPVRR